MIPNQSNQALGPDDQTARLNSGGDAIEAMKTARADEDLTAQQKFAKWVEVTKKLLGVAEINADVPNDNATLAAALRRIAESGAPDPIRVRNVVAFPGDPALSMETDQLVFVHFLNPRARYSADERMVATSPDVVIAELAALGIRRR